MKYTLREIQVNENVISEEIFLFIEIPVKVNSERSYSIKNTEEGKKGKFIVLEINDEY